MVLAFHSIVKMSSCHHMELHFFKMIISFIQISLGQANSTSTHLPPFNQILLPLHTLHVHSRRTSGSGQHQNWLKKKPQGYWQGNTVLVKLKITSWPHLDFSLSSLKAEWPGCPHPHSRSYSEPTPWLTWGPHTAINYSYPGPNQSVNIMTPSPSVAIINEFPPHRLYPLEASQKPVLIAHVCLHACTIS